MNKVVLNFLVNDYYKGPSYDLNLDPTCLYLGLPTKGSSLTPSYKNCYACNYLDIFKRKHDGKIITLHKSNAIFKNKIDDLWFRLNDQTIINPKTQQSIDIVNIVSEKKYLTIFGGWAFNTKQNKWEETQFWFSQDEQAIFCDCGFFTFSKIYIFVGLESVAPFKSRGILCKLSEFPQYQTIVPDMIPFHKYYSKMIVDPQTLKQAHKLFLEDSVTHIQINCLNGIVQVPYYLKPFFGDHSPVFHQNYFAGCGNHNIDYQGFKLIIDWLLYILLEKKYPSAQEIFEYKKDNEELKYIADYFDIPKFVVIFTLLDID